MSNKPDATRELLNGFLRRNAGQLVLLAALLGLVAVFSVLSPYFLQIDNGFNIVSASAYLGITAAAMTVVVIGGELDISVAAVMALSGVLTAQLLSSGVPWVLAVVAAIAAGGLVGLLNGVLIALGRLNALIVTIGMQFVVRGVAFAVADGREIRISNGAIKFIGQGKVVGIPLDAIITLFAFLTMALLLNSTVFGRHVFAIGGSPKMARLSGVRVTTRRIQLYVISGIFASISGLVLAGYTSSGIAYAATGTELLVVSAVILGGTALGGGYGSVVGTFVGVLILGVIANGMILLSVPSYYRLIMQGGILLLAIVIGETRRPKVDR